MQKRNEQEIIARMAELCAALEHHAALYYEKDSPEITDAEYDSLFAELKALELDHPELALPDSPTLRVGGRVADRFEKVRHIVPMGSLTDIFSLEELYAFDRRIRQSEPDAEYVTECKIDGLSVSLEYTNGLFTRGLTRGDGAFGEDVTGNLRTIRNIPLRLKKPLKHLVVRGEVYMPKSVFAELNAKRDAEGKPPFANPRNAAAGSVRQLDSSLAAERKLDIFVFNIQYSEDAVPPLHSEALDYLAELGFKVSPIRSVQKTAEEVAAEIERIGILRPTLENDTDGAVIKINSLAMRERLGDTGSVPRWAAAFKYPPETALTVVRDIVINVGRTGVLTPKAIMEPVRLAGTTVSQATLHNIDFISQKDIRTGDTVRLQKAGDIIPEVVEVLKENRPEGAVPFEMPESCPSCGEKVLREQGEAAVRCVNPDCPAQLHRSIIHFVSRGAMNIESVGESVAGTLISAGLVKSAADLYYLKKEDIEVLDRLGEKSASNIIASIEKSKSAGLARLLYALGIRHIGEKAALLIANAFGDIYSVMNASEEELCLVDEIGPESAASAVRFFSGGHAGELVKRLEQAGVSLKSGFVKASGALDGKTVVVTGTLPTLKRDEAEALIRRHGGNPSGSVSKKTSLLLCGADAGSKLAKANSLGIPVISEDDLLALIGEEKPR